MKSYPHLQKKLWEKETLSPWRWNNKQEVEEKIKTSCARILLSLKERGDIFPPATSGHVLKLLPTMFLQRVSEEEEAREGGGALSQMLGCLDVKDAFWQVPQEKPLKVNLRGELVKRNLPGQRVAAKAWLDFFTGYFTEEPNYKFSAECPCLGRNEKSIFLIHVDDLIFTGCSKYRKVQDRFDASVSKIEKIRDEFEFNSLNRKYKLEKDGAWIQPGNYIQQMLKAYEEQVGKIQLQQLPSDKSIQMEDKSEILNDQEKIILGADHTGLYGQFCNAPYALEIHTLRR